MHFHQYKKFYDKSIGYFGKFHNAPKNDVIATLLKNWQTWDLYGIHYMFYKRSNPEGKRSEPDDSKWSKPDDGKRSNPEGKRNESNDIYMSYIHELMIEQIDPDPTKRKTASELMDKILEIYYLSN